MTSISRLWLAFAAMGAGTIHLAVGASAPVLLAIILVGFGAAELGWGVVTLVRGRLVAADLALFGSLIPVFVWGATTTLGSGFGLPSGATGLPLFPMMVASLFGLFIAAALAIGRRTAQRGIRPSGGASTGERGTGPTDGAATPQGWRFLVALTIGGLLFSGLTTPALAATEAGAHAVPHGSHDLPASTTPTLSPSGHHH
ncbi:hypothetical protein RCH16_002428 [Cryobacterium sp. MP_M5]|uniref:hypothetical protein n=1 Tax=unclassified Cryobacterium TaxID=2649013 RepID=UPI0018CB11BA|nr:MULTISPECIES: hypothetical protein [unclassified Cryobacterium]MBG6059121.1 hypothetical protein [Cryobacterium sp. MP_M3]MEC5177415.1 hypothetical protein [Cryobacterium sp. MP_M5]